VSTTESEPGTPFKRLDPRSISGPAKRLVLAFYVAVENIIRSNYSIHRAAHFQQDGTKGCLNYHFYLDTLGMECDSPCVVCRKLKDAITEEQREEIARCRAALMARLSDLKERTPPPKKRNTLLAVKQDVEQRAKQEEEAKLEEAKPIGDVEEESEDSDEHDEPHTGPKPKQKRRRKTANDTMA